MRPGATLTIEPGTIIRGDKGSKAALIIARGGKINAEGTAARPIVFPLAQSYSPDPILASPLQWP